MSYLPASNVSRNSGRSFGPLLTLVVPVDSEEPESVVRVGHWIWVQYEKENGKIDNNLALPVAILCYKGGEREVALLWGKEIQEGSDAGLQRVVCTDECGIVDRESINGGVIEEETQGRVVTENSKGDRFSLDRHHVFSASNGCLAVGTVTHVA